jgi:hypothetical protein
VGIVDASCESATCASWSAIIENNGQSEVEADWVAELQVRTGSTGFQTVDTDSGTEVFGPGQNTVGSRFCDSFPPDTQQFRIRLYIVTTGYPCTIPAKMSPVVAACSLD